MARGPDRAERKLRGPGAAPLRPERQVGDHEWAMHPEFRPFAAAEVEGVKQRLAARGRRAPSGPNAKWGIMVRQQGFEPRTKRLRVSCSTS